MTTEHAMHDVRRYESSTETRFWCRTCSRGWSDMRIADYAREHAEEEGD